MKNKILILDRYSAAVIYEGNSVLDARAAVRASGLALFELDFEAGRDFYFGHARSHEQKGSVIA